MGLLTSQRPEAGAAAATPAAAWGPAGPQSFQRLLQQLKNSNLGEKSSLFALKFLPIYGLYGSPQPSLPISAGSVEKRSERLVSFPAKKCLASAEVQSQTASGETAWGSQLPWSSGGRVCLAEKRAWCSEQRQSVWHQTPLGELEGSPGIRNQSCGSWKAACIWRVEAQERRAGPEAAPQQYQWLHGPSKRQHSSPVSNPGGYDSRQPGCQRQQRRKLLAIASLGFFSGLWSRRHHFPSSGYTTVPLGSQGWCVLRFLPQRIWEHLYPLFTGY